MRSFLPELCALTGLLLASACLSRTPPGVFLASQPPGARIVVNERDSGFVTPCLIALDREERHRVRLELAGHEPREVVLVPGKRVLFIPYYHAVSEGQHFPLFARTEDLFFPLRTDKNLQPGRIHLRLHPVPLD